MLRRVILLIRLYPQMKSTLDDLLQKINDALKRAVAECDTVQERLQSLRGRLRSPK